MESDLRSEQKTAKLKVNGWGIAALVASIGSNLLLINICFIYFSFLGRGALLGSYVDSRGGLWEINGVVPFLMLVAVIGGLAASKLNAFKRLAVYSAISAIVFGVVCFTLVHFIRSSLR